MTPRHTRLSGTCCVFPSPLNLVPGREAEAAGQILNLNGISPQHPNYGAGVQAITGILQNFARNNPSGGSLPTDEMQRVVTPIKTVGPIVASASYRRIGTGKMPALLTPQFPKREISKTIHFLNYSHSDLFARMWIADSESAHQNTRRTRFFPTSEEITGLQESLYPEWWGTPPRFRRASLAKMLENASSATRRALLWTIPTQLAVYAVMAEMPGLKISRRRTLICSRTQAICESRNKHAGSVTPEETTRVLHSSMALAPRMINHTRFAFGTQENSSARYAVRDVEWLKQVPHPAASSNLGDDLLRRSCLRCHLCTAGSNRAGERRG